MIGQICQKQEQILYKHNIHMNDNKLYFWADIRADEKYLLTLDVAEENKKDTSVVKITDTEKNFDYIFYY